MTDPIHPLPNLLEQASNYLRSEANKIGNAANRIDQHDLRQSELARATRLHRMAAHVEHATAAELARQERRNNTL